MRTVFFGTPAPAVPSLKALRSSGHSVAAVVTAPDRPRGRGMKLLPSPVKEAALEAGLPVMQPRTLRDESVQADLAALGAAAFVVCAYGLILPPAVLSIPPLGCINVHFSLLPRWRGAAPVERAIIAGDDRTGVTIMRMDEGMDTGPVISTATIDVAPDDTGGSLTGKLAAAGAKLLAATLAAVESGAADPVPQDDALATTAPKIVSTEARIDWTEPAAVIERKIRAFDPRPGAWTGAGNARLKVFRARAAGGDPGAAPGTVVPGPGGELRVATGTEWLTLTEVQPEGKRRMGAQEWLRGRPDLSGNILA